MNQAPARILLIVMGSLCAAMFIIFQVLNNETGGLAGATKYLGGMLAISCLVYPKSALWIIPIESFYLDFYKKLAVYYGEARMITVMEVLAVGMLAVGCTYVGLLVQWAMRRVKPDGFQIKVMVITFLFASFLFVTSTAKSGVVGGVQTAVNTGMYITLVAVMCAYYTSLNEYFRYFRFICWLAVPWAIWGVRQYYFGFTEMEWMYAQTGFSPVTTNHMLGSMKPRPSGLASNSPAYAIVSLLAIWAWFDCIRFRKKWSGVAALILTAGTLASGGRTGIVYPLIMLPCYFCFRSRLGTMALYSGMAGLALVGIMSSGYILRNLGTANDVMRASIGAENNEWSNQTVSLLTFSDRLRGWERLTRPESWTLFGTLKVNEVNEAKFDDADYNHDMINKILLYYGVVGLVVVGFIVVFIMWNLHAVPLRQRPGLNRDACAFLLAMLVPLVVMGFLGGGNFGTVPHNLVYASFLGGVVLIAKLSPSAKAMRAAKQGAKLRGSYLPVQPI